VDEQSKATQSEVAAAGWYPDPHNPSRWRWWDGSTWTDNYSVAGKAAFRKPTLTPRQQRTMTATLSIIALVFTVFFMHRCSQERKEEQREASRLPAIQKELERVNTR
jgi:uncharacterized protein DUF2510